MQLIHPALEREPVRPARFAAADGRRRSRPRTGARLLSEALRLSLRRGAGPFRSAARLGFEPRAYQLVPLLMALRLPVVRLLIADDVGIGKTIEAGLILRELIDRGEVDRFAVLCPPHLVEQWTGELERKFDLDAVAVTAASASRLERGLPASQTLFDAYPYTVVSLDYIKAERRRDSFARSCPSPGRGRRGPCLRRHASKSPAALRAAQASCRRYRASPDPAHRDAAQRRRGGLRPPAQPARSRALPEGALESEATRERLARHFVQRRRIDITGRGLGRGARLPAPRNRGASLRAQPRRIAPSMTPCSITASAWSRAPGRISVAAGSPSGARWR